MATLTANINATQTVIPVSGAAPETGSYFTLNSEAVRFLGTSRGPGGRAFLRTYWSLDRGVAGTTKATHSSGATLTQYYPDAVGSGGGGVNIDNGTDPPAPVTSLTSKGAVIVGASATLSTVGVTVVLSSSTPTDLAAGAGAHEFTYDQVFDNTVDYNTLVALPDGLGLSVAIDGSSPTFTVDEHGVWTFTLQAIPPGFLGGADATIAGYLGMFGPSLGNGFYDGGRTGRGPSVSEVVYMTAGTTFNFAAVRTIAATNPTHDITIWLSLTRLV